jgi:MFS superfamily sulfate permease-like transporter
MFSAKVEMKETGNDLWIEAKSSLVFSNYISLMKTLSKIPAGKHVTMDVSNASIIDHSTMENLHHFDEDYTRAGGQFKLKGLDQFTQRSHHKFSVRIHKKK